MDSVLAWVVAYDRELTWLVIGSALFFVASLALIPWLVVQIPADYFLQPGKRRSPWHLKNPTLSTVFKIAKNVLATVIVALGILLLALPGQGLLTILLGLMLADFPGKHQLVNRLVRRPSVASAINWLRAKAHKPPLQLPEE